MPIPRQINQKKSKFNVSTAYDACHIFNVWFMISDDEEDVEMCRPMNDKEISKNKKINPCNHRYIPSYYGCILRK